MTTYLMFGTYSPEALKAVSAKRSEEAVALIKKYGGEFKAAYALLGEVDLVVILDLPDTERALQTSAALAKLLGVSFRTAPAVSVDEFDKLMAGPVERSEVARPAITMDQFILAATEEARIGLAEGGIPIGSVIVHQGRIIGRGHNRRVQRGSAVLHAEMDALENAGRQPASVYRESVLYTTLSPCAMCSGAILLYGIPKVVIGENQTFLGEEGLLQSRGVEVEVLQDTVCLELMRKFIADNPALWNEDIGVI